MKSAKFSLLVIAVCTISAQAENQYGHLNADEIKALFCPSILELAPSDISNAPEKIAEILSSQAHNSVSAVEILTAREVEVLTGVATVTSVTNPGQPTPYFTVNDTAVWAYEALEKFEFHGLSQKPFYVQSNADIQDFSHKYISLEYTTHTIRAKTVLCRGE